MATQYTSLLGFALPVTGELSGTWGDTVNNSITQLVEDSVAGVATQSVASADWTLSTTGSGQTNQARCAILRPTGSSGVARNIIAPSSSKAYIVDNQSNVAVTVKGAATTGVAVAASTAALVAWNGSDFVLVAQNLANATGTLAVSKGGTGQTTYTDGQLLIGNSSGNTLTKATLTAGSGVTITNGNGSISIAATGSGGTVTNVGTSNGPAPINGLTLTGGPITGSGTVTLGGSISGISLTTQVTGTLPVGNGGTGLSAVGTSGNVLTSNGTAWVSQAAGGGANIQTFSVTGTYTKPPGAKFVMVELWGGGGGGQGGGYNTGSEAYGGDGGAGGGYNYSMFAAPTVGATETVTVGAGGAGGGAINYGDPTVYNQYGNYATNGGTSNFGTLIYSNGGLGGGHGRPADPPRRLVTLQPTTTYTQTLSGGGLGGAKMYIGTGIYQASPSMQNNVSYFVMDTAGGTGGRGGAPNQPDRPGTPGTASAMGGGGGGGGGGYGPLAGIPYGGPVPATARNPGGSGAYGMLSRQAPSIANVQNASAEGASGNATQYSPGTAGTAGAAFNGGGGGGSAGGTGQRSGTGGAGGNGGTAAGGGGGGSAGYYNSTAAGGTGGNGLVVVYTW